MDPHLAFPHGPIHDANQTPVKIEAHLVVARTLEFAGQRSVPTDMTVTRNQISVRGLERWVDTVVMEAPTSS